MIMNPKKATLFTTIVLILVGMLSYFVKSSPTALIPVLFGVLMGVFYKLYDKNNKLFAHIIMILMLVVFIALFMPLNKRIESHDMNGILRVGIMQLSALYSMVCFIVSFIKARKE
tara:strand:- start:8 stop:352 length:345 start_codon:yes stop_codon:yes gene_type:complete